jgi:hypothetical protein
MFSFFFGCKQSAMIKFMYCYLALSRKRRQPRKNVTKETAEPSTPRRPTREEILRDSTGRVTRR